MWGFNQSSFSCICVFSCPGIIYWKHYPFSNCFYTFLKNPLSIYVWFYFWTLYSDWVAYLSILTPHCLDPEIWNQLVDVLQLCSSVSVCLGYEYSALPDEFQIQLVNSYKSLLRVWLGLHWLYKSIYKRSINCWPWLLHLLLTKECPLILLKCVGHCYYWTLLVKCIHMPDVSKQM